MTDPGTHKGPDTNGRGSASGRLRLSALVLFVGLPIYASAGWLIWLASEQRPWLASLGFILAVLFLLNWPFEMWLKRREWFKRMAGDGAFRDTVLKFPTLYLPALVIVGVSDLDHGRNMAENLREYMLSTIAFMALIVLVEIALAMLSRWWKSRSTNRGADA